MLGPKELIYLGKFHGDQTRESPKNKQGIVRFYPPQNLPDHSGLGIIGKCCPDMYVSMVFVC